MAPVQILKFPISSPGDTSPLQKIQEAGYDPSQILAVVGKTEGNGCVNDFSRTLASAVWEPLIPADAVTVFSGGTEGVLSPHVTFFLRETGDATTGLSASVGHTRTLAPHEVGTEEQTRQVATTVAQLIRQMDVTPEQVHLVLVKCPLLTSDKLQAIRAQGRVPITSDTYESMARSRYASAIGIAAALGEVPEGGVPAIMRPGQGEHHWSAKASCSSGAELDDCHILVLASSSPTSSSSPPREQRLHAVSRPMADAMDAASILHLLDQVRKDDGEVLQVFAKAEADPSGRVRGFRHTMNTDSDIHSTRHARAAVGGLIAGLVSDAQIYVSGGGEGQGPSGGGSLCLVYRTPG
ncbi:ring-opening amidohydrolase [Emericellopsis atlantica]|uniref:Cyanuric acid amidohydrolase n=1 Tax=Emericellopsis atlantica TaxID=2614577 RepID=A0A9P7ZQC7_9HYPO|nr:ring-opening amidohydrolase [Emericellopsis atlantica]KAG9255770.1 ring-opening amidohydrolase [Emericellopsis atlantica]